MSEKRFKVDYEVGVLDTKTNEIICDTVNADEVVALLNELSEENRELKQEVFIYKKAFQEQVQRCTL